MLIDQGLEILGEQECFDLLATRHVGRVAVTVGALPAIFPVNYALMGGTIVFRTGEGTKLSAALRNAVVAFEIDEFDGFAHGGWSVMAVGMARELDGAALDDARRLPLRPWADGERDRFVQVVPELVSGRRIVHAPV
jgi:nitroimidazol reductase NimA-like FMN-containing flavoprotein (pyridoxamine 5'-phosphate oxidase superfamily)